MLIYDIGFLTKDGKQDYTQIDVEEGNQIETEIIDMINILLDLKDELNIKEVNEIIPIYNEDNEEEC